MLPNGRHVMCAFAFYSAMQLLVVPAFFGLWLGWSQESLEFPPALQGWFNWSAVSAAAAAVAGYAYYLQQTQGVRIWNVNKGSAWRNSAIGVLLWAAAFPCVLGTAHLLDFLVKLWVEIPTVEQVAVHHVKQTLQYPLLSFLTFFGVVVLAPLAEELLFRGFLQNWMRQFWGATWAVLITSAIFAAFHFSSSQGVANVELIGALFVFSLFLGVSFEARGSLWTPFALHMTFNAVSSLMILVQSLW